MTEAVQKAKGAPWHLWLVGIIGLFWNGFGCYDCFMTTTGGEDYLRAFGLTEDQIAYFNAMPAWMTVVWVIGVGGGLAGTILLLLRSKWAFEVFALSLAAYLFSLVYTYALSNGAELMPDGSVIMNIVIAAGCIFFAWYAWTMRKRGVLR